jgi:6-phosphogluconolactonase/glucosamine-6-phosphate isomerase/deaminase
MTKSKVTITDDIPKTLADELLKYSKTKEEFTFLATGGNQAIDCYPTLKETFRVEATQGRLVVGDERLVPLTSSWSNTSMLFDQFESAGGGLQISSPILPFEAELRAIEEIMANEGTDLAYKRASILENYSGLLRQVVANFDRIISKSPKATFVHLGLGPDGHVASLFPNCDDLDITGKFSQISLDLDQNNKMLRTSVTFDMINSADIVVVSTVGYEKGKLIARALDQDPAIPLSKLSPRELVFLVDPNAGEAIYGR